MTLANDLKHMLHTGARPILSTLGLRQVRVIIRTTTWSTGRVQSGAATTADVEIIPRPRVEGRAGDPQIRVSKITPAYDATSAYAAGGFSRDQLAPADAAGTSWTYVVIWPDGIERRYKLLRLTQASRVSQALEYILDLQSLDRAVPF
jgi:hypothetical protein